MRYKNKGKAFSMNGYKPEGSLITTPKNYEYTSSKSELETALEKQVILEAVAYMCDHDLNLHVNFPCGIKGIIPRNEAQLCPIGETAKDIAILTRVGKTVCFKVIGFKEGPCGNKTAILSRKAAQKECMENYIDTLIPGDIIPSKVTHLEKFGAFIDIGCGIIALLSIDSISVSRISHPAERFCVGDTIFTVLKSIDENGRIFVTTKELFGSWEENASKFSEGQTVQGVVRSIESYGIFIELMPNLSGLAEYKNDIEAGKCVAVYIKSIIPDKMKFKLILIDKVALTLPRREPEYFVDVKNKKHIDSWIYSPVSSKKIIETIVIFKVFFII